MATRVEEVKLTNGRTLVSEFQISGITRDGAFVPTDLDCAVYTIGPRGGRQYDLTHASPSYLRRTARRYLALADAAEKRWRELTTEEPPS